MKLRRRRGPLNVAILGAGPAALFAAQAVYDTGNVVQIYSRGERSALYGAQYLHEPVPNLSLRAGGRETVSYILKGTVDSYRRKVYGDGSTVQVSPEVLPFIHNAWDIRSAYRVAWERFNGLIRPTDITQSWLRAADSAYLNTRDQQPQIDLVIWSIPLVPFCYGNHAFLSQDIWAQGDAPELGLYCSVQVAPGTVVANGEDSPRWYRASNVFGYRTAEWPTGIKPPISGIARVTKPISTNCDCWTNLGAAPVLRVGRYGCWKKDELSHSAYFLTRNFLEAMH